MQNRPTDFDRNKALFPLEAKQKLSVRELRSELDYVAVACKHRESNTANFYKWRRKFQAEGFEGLKKLRPLQEFETELPEDVVRHIEVAALRHPSENEQQLSGHLRLSGLDLGIASIKRVLEASGLATPVQRLRVLEKQIAQGVHNLSTEQTSFVERLNPSFRERTINCNAPGETLLAYSTSVGALKGVGKVFLHTVVDCYSSFAFGFLHHTNKPEASVAVLHNEALPFFQSLGISVKLILTSKTRTVFGSADHPYGLYLDLRGISREFVDGPMPRSNGVAEFYDRTVFEEFFRKKMRERRYASIEELQSDFDDWLHYYNTYRPHYGFRNREMKPIEMIVPAF